MKIEPRLVAVPVASIRPTQMTVGYWEVARKREEWDKRGKKDGAFYLGHHMIPVVVGPEKRLFAIDHHHLLRALDEEGDSTVLPDVRANLSHLEPDLFWKLMDKRNWLHPYDEHGKRCGFEDIPEHVGKLRDDPYRSLSGELRRRGGFAKSEIPFVEFLWADYLRSKIAAHQLKDDMKQAVTQALMLAHNSDADHLPGWCGKE